MFLVLKRNAYFMVYERQNYVSFIIWTPYILDFSILSSEYCVKRFMQNVRQLDRALNIRFLTAWPVHSRQLNSQRDWEHLALYEFVWMWITVYDYARLMYDFDCVWLCMTMYDNVWLYMTMYDYVWLCMTMYDYLWLCMTMFDYVRQFKLFSCVSSSMKWKFTN